MKTLVKFFTLLAIVSASLTACEKDEGKLPNIGFKTGGNYKSADATVPTGSEFVIGITASKSEDKDVLKKFNISRSIDGGANTTVFEKDLSGSEGDNFSYDYSDTMDVSLGNVNHYTFTVTNRDGLTNQVSININKQ